MLYQVTDKVSGKINLLALRSNEGDSFDYQKTLFTLIDEMFNFALDKDQMWFPILVYTYDVTNDVVGFRVSFF